MWPTIKKHIWKNSKERLLVVVLAMLVIVAASSTAYAAVYEDRVYPGVFVGSLALGGLTRAEAEASLSSSIDTLDANGLTFVFRDRLVNVPTVVTATEDPDLSYELIDFPVKDSVEVALSYGRTGTVLNTWQERIAGLLGRSVIIPRYEWREESIRKLLRENLATLEHPAINSQLDIQNGIASLTQDKEGIVFDYEQALIDGRAQLESLLFAPIPLKLKKDLPSLTRAQAEPLLTQAQAALFGAGVSVQYDGKSWFWPASTLNSLLEIRLTNGIAELGFSQEKFQGLFEPISASINIEPQEPKFAIENNRVVEFKAPNAGRRVSVLATLSAWEQELLVERVQKIEPIVETIEPKQEIADINDLGITELLGVGTSDFAGSPPNRRHNIRIGAEAVNGTLLAPGEEFSLLATLGTIDGSTGYLPELVIKGNQTIPEFGGGLCQIGTTTFRGTLSAGLPVTARRNHSYAVSYYNDTKGLPGTDATIYDPAPDYRFRNDTKNHVLISTRIVGDELFFEYWGTKDGREVVQSDTRVWDRVSPPETKYIETLDLPVGKIKCTESPHAGIKAAFDYTITYADGTVDETTFRSQYRPWQEVCLIGVTELSEEVDQNTLELEGADIIDATI